MLPRDLQAIQQAFPQERAFQESNPFTPNGIGFQGVPADEPYMIGDELNSLDQGQFNQGVTMGGLSAQNIYQVTNSFPDQVPAYNANGYDSQKGIVTRARPVNGMLGENMYYDVTSGQAVSFHEANAQPELQGYHPTVNSGPGSTVE